MHVLINNYPNQQHQMIQPGYVEPPQQYFHYQQTDPTLEEFITTACNSSTPLPQQSPSSGSPEQAHKPPIDLCNPDSITRPLCAYQQHVDVPQLVSDPPPPLVHYNPSQLKQSVNYQETNSTDVLYAQHIDYNLLRI